MSKNIEEFVIKNVIKHMEYRDTEIIEMQNEIQTLKDLLEVRNVVKCGGCNHYGEYIGTCDICEIESCSDCECKDRCVKSYRSPYLSGTCLCNACANLHCAWCHRLKTDHEPNDCSPNVLKRW